VLAYGFGGSFHAYRHDDKGAWRPRPFSTGHFLEVTDLQWEPQVPTLLSRRNPNVIR
jgi:hypothetical protein